MISELEVEIPKRGGVVSPSPFNKQIVINNEFVASVFISRLKTKGPRIWQFGYRSERKPDIVIGARVAERGGPIVDYFILPFMFLPHGSWITTSLSSGLRLERFRSKTLEPFYDLCARAPLEAPRW